jgi:serine/threonine protein kinase
MYPQKIGRYEIKAELGRGGMATVYKAYDPTFEREVALKVLPQELLHDAQFRGRFEREAKIIARLEHAAIVPVYDVGQEKDQPYFVMRYMAGGSLSERMGDAPMSLPETAHIIQRIAAALDYAHSKGIIHRDLKPGNILFDETGSPFISDYGIAKLALSQTNLTGSSIIGTPTYMSPEQAQGEEIDGRSDIYSLGVIIYEMLSGKPPYHATTPLGVVFKHVSEPIPHILDINPNLPASTEAVIEKAMAKDPNNRFRVAMDLAVALDDLARGEIPDLDRTVPVGTHLFSRPKSTAETISIKPSKSRLWVWGGIALVILAALIWGGVHFAAQSIPLTPTLTPSFTPMPPTHAIPPPRLSTPLPVIPVANLGLGGLDKIALIAGNNIWSMNPDGSELIQLSNDSKPKFDLQWLPDGKRLLYIEDKCTYTLDATTQKITRVVCFDDVKFLDGFRVSPDGKQVAISLDRRLYVMPFDLQNLANMHNRAALDGLKGCLSYTAISAKSALWSRDSQKLAVMYALGHNDGRVADTIRVVDVHRCQDGDPLVLDDFPARHFIPEGYTDNLILPSFSWDGADLFLINTFKRNDGYGHLYSYDLSIGQEKKINPIKGLCCYRDARFSPDGQFVLFAYQDFSKGSDSETLVYYIPLKDMGSDKTFEPLKLPFNFFTNPREKPEFALRAVAHQ